MRACHTPHMHEGHCHHHCAIPWLPCTRPASPARRREPGCGTRSRSWTPAGLTHACGRLHVDCWCVRVCVCTHTHEHGCSRDRWGVRVHAGDLDIVLMPCTVSGTGGLCPRVLKPSWLVSWLAGIARKCGVCIGMASRCGEMMRHGQLAAHAARTRGSGYGALRSRRAFCCARQHPTASFTSSQ